MKLSDAAIRSAKPAATPYKLTDGLGMYLLIHPAGGKLWRLDYRFDGKRKTLAMGSYPDISLKQARGYRDEARNLIANGTDPAELKKSKKDTVTQAREVESAKAERERMMKAGEALPGSFRHIGEEWASKFMADKVESHRARVIRRLEKEVYPYIGNLSVLEVTAPVILEVLRRIEARGIIETARRTKQNIGQILRYAIATGHPAIDYTPALSGALTPMPPDKHHAAPTEPAQAAELLRVISTYRGQAATRCALFLAPLLFVRPVELRTMQWADVHLDTAEWRFLSTKRKKDLIVPLARQAVDALRDLQPLTGGGRYVFPGARTVTRPMSESTINGALKRLGIDTQNELTGHGFRAMARTMLAEIHGFPSDVLELQITHKVTDPLGRAYNRTSFLHERKRMMQVWADYLDNLREG